MLGFYPISAQPIAGSGASGEEYTFSADTGSFALTGQAATFNKALRVDAQAALFTLSLQGAAKLITEFTPDGQFSVSTNPVNFGISYAVNSGSFSLTGNAAPKKITDIVSFGDFEVIQSEINFGFSFTALAGSFIVTGQEITEDITDVFGSGSFALTLEDASVTAQRGGPVTSGSFSLTVYDIKIKGFLSPYVPPAVYTEQTVPAEIWAEQTEPTDIWVEQVDASSPTYTEASDTSANAWTEAA